MTVYDVLRKTEQGQRIRIIDEACGEMSGTAASMLNMLDGVIMSLEVDIIRTEESGVIVVEVKSE